jgi:hypothetical protein
VISHVTFVVTIRVLLLIRVLITSRDLSSNSQSSTHQKLVYRKIHIYRLVRTRIEKESTKRIDNFSI